MPEKHTAIKIAEQKILLNLIVNLEFLNNTYFLVGQRFFGFLV